MQILDGAEIRPKYIISPPPPPLLLALTVADKLTPCGVVHRFLGPAFPTTSTSTRFPVAVTEAVWDAKAKAKAKADAGGGGGEGDKKSKKQKKAKRPKLDPKQAHARKVQVANTHAPPRTPSISWHHNPCARACVCV